MRNAFKILVQKPQLKRQFVRLRHRLENNIKMDLRETSFQGASGLN
jgi:hypothetical protein